MSTERAPSGATRSLSRDDNKGWPCLLLVTSCSPQAGMKTRTPSSLGLVLYPPQHNRRHPAAPRRASSSCRPHHAGRTALTHLWRPAPTPELTISAAAARVPDVSLPPHHTTRREAAKKRVVSLRRRDLEALSTPHQPTPRAQVIASPALLPLPALVTRTRPPPPRHCRSRRQRRPPAAPTPRACCCRG